jgi:hypothetical protein
MDNCDGALASDVPPHDKRVAPLFGDIGVLFAGNLPSNACDTKSGLALLSQSMSRNEIANFWTLFHSSNQQRLFYYSRKKVGGKRDSIHLFWG